MSRRITVEQGRNAAEMADTQTQQGLKLGETQQGLKYKCS